MVPQLLAQAQADADKLRWAEAADMLAGAGDDSLVLDRRGWYLSRAKRYSEALTIFEELSRREPENFRPYYMAGSQHYERGNYRDALPWLEEALKRDPKHLKAWWRRAYALRATGDEAGAHKSAARVLAIWHAATPEEKERGKSVVARASHMLAKAQLQSFPEDALELARQAVANDPDDPYHHHLLGRALLRIGLAEEAVLSLRRAQQLKRCDPSIELALAEALARNDEKEAAITAIAGVERGLRGWQAFKAGRVALDSGSPSMAMRLLSVAGTDRQVQGDQRLAELIARANNARPDAEEGGSSRRQHSEAEPAMGTIDVLRRDKGFGFLIDDRDGSRRFFRINGIESIDRGNRVRFVPYDAEKGPAARAVQPA